MYKNIQVSLSKALASGARKEGSKLIYNSLTNFCLGCQSFLEFTIYLQRSF